MRRRLDLDELEAEARDIYETAKDAYIDADTSAVYNRDSGQAIVGQAHEALVEIAQKAEKVVHAVSSMVEERDSSPNAEGEVQ